MTSILYNNLKTLITNNQLVPEEQYRITDYVTTVSKANYTSAGYKFDIVVTALTTNTLYEYATLMADATETYFDDDALLLYNIKYNVNNVIPGYYNDWVNVNGKGCIYYMVDDKGNEAPYDFKNIKYNGKFLFNNNIDGTDTSQSVSDYNSVKEVIEDNLFTIPLVSFNDACSGCTIDINAGQLIITESSNLQIGNNCKDSEFTNVNNTTIGNDLSGATLTSIDGAEIGDNCVSLEITNQTNLILGNNNNTITLGGGNGIIIDSNNTNVTIGTNAKDIYINGSKTVDLGNNIEQFNISSSYNMTVADDCKLFTLNETNHFTSTSGCEGINTIKNDYITLTEEVKNVTVSGGLTNIVLDGTKLVGTDTKVIVQQDEKVVVVNEQTNSEVVLVEDGTTTSNPNSYITDSPADGLIYGRKDGNWEQIDTSGDYEVTYDDVVGALTYVPISTDKIGVANGLAMLDAQGYVLNAQLPSYVDDIIEVDTFTLLPVTGEKGKIYIVTDSGKTYRWATTQYVAISESLTLGTGSEQAYPGNLGAALRTDVDGKANISHTHIKSEVGLANVDNTSDLLKPISTATQSALNNKANTVHTHIKSEVGLANVDNTSDANKPISNATQTALNSKANKATTLSGYGITDAYTKTDTDTAINAIEVGGRNLIPNTKDLTGYPYRTSDTYLGFNIARTTRGATGYVDTFATITIDVAAGSTYIASFYAKASVNTPMHCHWYSPNTTTSALTSTGYASTSVDGSAVIQVTTEWKKYWVVWTQTLTELPKRLIIGRNSAIEGAVLEIAGIKLEKGNKATDWTPAPEDINEDILDLQTNKANTSHTHIKSEVGLANVDNTSDVNKPVSNATQTALNSKAPITGVSNQFIIGRTYNNVFNKYFTTSPTQILIKTGCNMAISSAIIVKISGYAHYSASIIDLQLMIRLSGGTFGHFRCLNSGPFNPDIQAFTYVDGGVTKLGFSFKEYFSYTTLNISVEDEFGTYVSSGWSSEDNAATGTYFTLTNPLNPYYVSNFASKINGVTYNGLSDITIQDNTKAPTVHTHNASDINAGDMSLDRLSKMKKYVASRGENLVTNGTGLLKDNTNFSRMTYNGVESYNCDGSFTTASGSWMLTDETMPVNPDLAYRLLYYIKAKPWVGSGVLAGIACFDTDGLEIMPSMTMYVPNTLTTLAEDLKNGDTIVKFTNLTNNWINVAGAGTYVRTLIFWNYVDNYGKSYPELTYSRNSFKNSWDPGAVNYATNTITLNKPWSNGTIVAGTKVSNGNDGGTYKYLGNRQFIPTTEWTAQQDVISGIDLSGINNPKSFHPGTASIKLVFGLNRDVTGGQHYISNISFGVETHPDAVLYNSVQTLNSTQQAQARTNIGAGTSSFSGNYNDLSNKPTSMPASDVSAWAKATTKPTYNASEIGGLGVSYRWLTDDYINTWNAKEPAITKLTAFNKNFGTTAGTISEGNHTHTFASLTSKPNTLSGYGITDACGAYEKIKTIVSTTSIALEKQYKIYKYNHSSGNIASFSFSNTLISDLGSGEAYTFEMEIQMPSGGTTITFPSTIVPLNGTTITLQAGKKNYLAFRTFDGINFIVNYQGYY